MKSMLTAMTLLSVISTPTAAFAHHNGSISPYTGEREYRGWSGSRSRTCYEQRYKEVYIPGTSQSPGYVDYKRKTVPVPCYGDRYWRPRPNPPIRGIPVPDLAPQEDNNDCTQGAILGGILGGGIAGGISEDDAMIWSIPLGIVSGAIVGCEADGG